MGGRKLGGGATSSYTLSLTADLSNVRDPGSNFVNQLGCSLFSFSVSVSSLKTNRCVVIELDDSRTKSRL